MGYMNNFLHYLYIQMCKKKSIDVYIAQYHILSLTVNP
jgi:hypothetical protein